MILFKRRLYQGLFFICFFLIFGCSDSNTIFLEELPLKCIVGKTTKQELSILIKEPIFGNSFTDREQRYGLYFDSDNILKIFVFAELTENWVENGIYKGMSEADLKKIFNKITYSDSMREESEYYYTVSYAYKGLKYNFGFPHKTNETFKEYKDQLTNIEISIIE